MPETGGVNIEVAHHLSEGSAHAHPYPDRMIKSEADQTTFDLTFQMPRRTPSARMQSIAYSSCPSIWSRSEAEALKSCCTR
jgi:hypothetical protein